MTNKWSSGMFTYDVSKTKNTKDVTLIVMLVCFIVDYLTKQITVLWCDFLQTHKNVCWWSTSKGKLFVCFLEQTQAFLCRRKLNANPRQFFRFTTNADNFLITSTWITSRVTDVFARLAYLFIPNVNKHPCFSLCSVASHINHKKSTENRNFFLF